MQECLQSEQLPEKPVQEREEEAEEGQIQDVEFEEAAERTKSRDWSDVRAALEAIAGNERQRMPAMSRPSLVQERAGKDIRG
ncbi:unnamed protein product [Cylicocyclus nassatus]|uniref:Uncharacterized protein n=1 Tax=Cylicocyclus nassatus TaxID=53992 RepID=A0AA36MGJ4_CYLNA|nr:unnamed protein product [Cylicocyclus nassatus]